VKTLAAPAKSPNKRRASITKAQADKFTDGLLKIAARIEGLPSDLARNHDHYLHALPRK
jgi:hypothetical protein